MTVRNVIEEKVHRLRSGESPRVLDLFAGCGGLSLGFQLAGFQTAASLEFDPWAARSHAMNFFGDQPSSVFESHSVPRDITRLKADDLVEELGLGPIESCIDVVIGGPPCQAYARVGRAKLREIQSQLDAFLQDPRGNLYLRFIEYVKSFKPVAVMMENVPDVMNLSGLNVAQEMCDILDGIGYVSSYTLLNSAYYGVPQTREKMFLIAYARELQAEVSFPPPTNWVNMPIGYEGSRNVARKYLTSQTGANGQPSLLMRKNSFQSPPHASPDLPPAITAREACEDLPSITLHLEGKLGRGARRFDTVIPYPEDRPVSQFAWDMRSWPGFANSQGIADHVIRSLPRDYAIFRRMNSGDQYPQAHAHALALLDEEIKRLQSLGQVLTVAEHEKLRQMIVPPYDVGKFPNKWRKMEANQPSRTLMAHIGKDSYSHIHYDSAQARTISVREAARLQSFPDGFVFEGAMNSAFRQIGNAVPPLMAGAIAASMLHAIRGAS